MSVTSNLRKYLKSNPEIAKFLMPGTKNEILLDLNGDGKMDFAFMDTTGNGMPETFALDKTGSGDLNLYFYDASGNGKADTVLYYPDGQDMPVYTKLYDKEGEEKLEKLLGGMRTAMKSNDAEEIKKCLFGLVDEMNARAEVYGKTGTLARMRAKMKEDPEMAKLLCQSPKNEMFFDLNEDGIADFALIDSNHDGEIDTMGMDLTGDGEFNLYLNDSDGNGITDNVTYYRPGDEEAALGSTSAQLEEALRPATMKLLVSLRSEFSAKNLIKTLKGFRKDALSALETIGE
jgi:hypothetical protein